MGMAAMDTDGLTTLATTIMERGLLTPNQPQMLMPRLSPGGMVDTMDGLTILDITITERGLLTPNQLQLQMLKPSPGGMDTMDTDGHTTVTIGVESFTSSVT